VDVSRWHGRKISSKLVDIAPKRGTFVAFDSVSMSSKASARKKEFSVLEHEIFSLTNVCRKYDLLQSEE